MIREADWEFQVTRPTPRDAIKPGKEEVIHPAFKVIKKDTDPNYVTFRHGLFRCGTSCPITRHIIDSRNGGAAVVQVVSDRQVESEHQQYWRERE